MSNEAKITRLPSQIQSQMPFFELEMNLKPMKKYLNDITEVVNKNADITEAIMEQITQHCDTKILLQQIQQMNQNTCLPNNQLLDIVNQQVKPKKSQSEMENETLSFITKLQQFGYGIDYNFKTNQRIQSRIEDLERQMQMKINKQDYSDKQQKLKNNIQQQFDNLNDNQSKQGLNLAADIKDQISNVKDQMSNIEKNTLWRIVSCEDELKKRITTNYVDDALKQFEDKFQRNIANTIQNDSNKLNQIKEDIENRVKNMEYTMQEKNKNFKRQLDSILSDLQTNYLQKNNFSELKVNVQNFQTDISKRLKDIEKNSQLGAEINHIQMRIKALETDLRNLSDGVNEKITEFLTSSSNNAGGGSSGGSGGQGGCVDIHQHCKMQADIVRNIEAISQLQKGLQQQEQQSGTKFQSLETSIFELLNRKEKENDTAKETYKLGQDIKQELMQYITNNDGKTQRELQNLNKKVEKFDNLDKKISKILKDFDIDKINKILKSKADHADVMKDFAIMDSKINKNSELIVFIRKDIDSIIYSLKKLLQQVNNNQDNNSILTTKKLTPVPNLNCLSCGSYNKASRSSQYINKDNRTTKQQNPWEHKQVLDTQSYNTVNELQEDLYIENAKKEKANQKQRIGNLSGKRSYKKNLRPESAKQ